MALLKQLYQKDKLYFSEACSHLQDISQWKLFCNALYEKEWCPYIKETFNGFGNAIEYLGKYTHKIAISNSRILSVADGQVTMCFHPVFKRSVIMAFLQTAIKQRTCV